MRRDNLLSCLVAAARRSLLILSGERTLLKVPVQYSARRNNIQTIMLEERVRVRIDGIPRNPSIPLN